MLVAVYGAVVETLKKPPGLARSPCAQRIMLPLERTAPPFARWMGEPAGLMISAVHSLVTESWVTREIAIVLLDVFGELRLA